MKKFLICLIVVMLAVPVFGAVDVTEINFSNVTSGNLDRYLRRWIDTLNTDITNAGGTSNVGTGKIFYVDSGPGNSSSATGTTPATAAPTLDDGVNLCTANRGDIIFVMQGHAETIDNGTSDAIDLDLAGITVIGLGPEKPEFTFDTATDELVLDADNIILSGLRFLAGVDIVTLAIDVKDGADDCVIINCEFPEPTTSSWEFVRGIVITTADRLLVANCSQYTVDAVGATNFIDNDGGVTNGVRIVSNYAIGEYAEGIYHSDDADLENYIAYNDFSNLTSGQHGIELIAAATGTLLYNTVFTDAVATSIDPGSLKCFENYVTTAINTTAALYPQESSEGRTSGTGTVYYVDSGTPGAGDGESWGTAVATLDAGVDLCTGDRGDVIYVAAGHSETLGSGADGVDADVAGITIIGKGVGENRPLFDFDTTTDEFVIGADDVSIFNLDFKSNIDSVAHAIDIEAGFENFVIDGCRFYLETTGTDDFDDVIIIAAGCDNGKITNCRFEMGAGSENQSAINTAGTDYLEISGNIITGDYAVACIEDATTASIWMIIEDNTLFNGTVGGVAGLNTIPCITLKSDTSALIINNEIFTNVASSDLAIVAANGFLSGNTYNETAASSTGNLGGLEVGRTYVATKAAVNTGSTEDLFLVTGFIQITNFFGEITVDFAGSPGTMTIELDSADNDYDSDFCTTVNVDAAAKGDWIKFTNVIEESVLSFTAGTSSMPAINWLCSPGMIEQTLSSTGTGNTTWYMTYIPLTPDVTVTAQ